MILLILVGLLIQQGLCQNFISDTREDLFSATSQLAELIEREDDVVTVLETYVNKAQESLHAMKQYVYDFRALQSNSHETRGNPPSATHPIDAYLILKRLTIEWQSLQEDIAKHINSTQEMMNNLDYLRERYVFPEIEDLHGAAVALVRLQDIYKLNMTTLTSGKFSGIYNKNTVYESILQLTARDCLFVGKHAFNQGYYDKAIDWFEAALTLSHSHQDNSASPTEINLFLDASIEVHDDILEKQGPRGADWQTRNVPIKPELANNHKNRHLKRTFSPKLIQQQTEEEEEEHFTRLCRGEKFRPEEIESKLHCSFYKGESKYNILVPLKLETSSLEPLIVIFHNFISDKEADRVIQQAKPRLFTSRHRGQDGEYVASMVRTSKNAWLQESPKDDDLLRQITRKIEFATNLEALKPTAGEEYQVANYGIGGLYVPHTDYLMTNTEATDYTSFESYIGDRLATFMIYLSDVEAGGATVFTRLGVSIWPEKGSAVFWFNTFRSGLGDEMTKHGACPVLHGSKWISNKWIHINDQFLTHPCGLNDFDRFKTL